MFALDLFNTDHERRLAEGAVDQLEQRRIDDLAMKMDDLVARAKSPAYKKNPAALAALMKEFQKCKAERDSYYKIRNETMGYGGLTAEAGIPGNIPIEKIPGKEDLLKGRGRSYYEGAEDYAGIYSPEAIALGKRFCEHYNITDDGDVQLAVEIIDSYLDEFKATDTPVDLKKIRSGVADAFRQVYRGMGPGPNFRKKFQETQKKNSEVGPLDQKLQRLKVQARRQFPLAHTDDEALILKILDKETQDDRENRRVDTRQDAELRKNFALDREQDDDIDNLQTQVSVKEHGGGIGPRQHWQDLMQENKLAAGDPVIVTAPNEFEGKTGEIYDFAPSGKFVIVNLYNHGKHSMHLSDVEYNQYADQEQDEEDDWYDNIDDGVRHAYDSDERTRSDQFEGYQSSSDSPVAGAITRRILLQRLDLLKQYGPELVGTAVDNVADYVGDVDEIGSSDVSSWVAQVERMLKENPPEAFSEGWSDAMVARRTGSPRTPYSVYINGKKWKDFENDDHAENVANKLRAKFKSQGKDPSVITIAPTDMSEAVDEKGALKSAQAAAKFMIRNLDDRAALKDYSMHFWSPEKFYQGATMAMRGVGVDEIVRHITQDRPAQFEEGIVASGPSKPLDDRAVRKMVWDTMKINADTGEQAIQRALSVLAKKPQSRMVLDLQDKFQSLADRLAQGVTEGVMSNLHADLADVYNRLAPGIERNRDSFKAGQLYDALEAVAEQHGAEAEFKRMMAGARNRAHMDYDTNPGGFQNWFWYLPFDEEELSEEQDTSAVERAILNRIMVAHTDLLMKFGPEKVMQAAEEVAYNVGDMDEIGTSDVSAYVHQVKQILGVPEEVNEKWSQKYKSSINCTNPKGFSQKAHCAGRKK